MAIDCTHLARTIASSAFCWQSITAIQTAGIAAQRHKKIQKSEKFFHFKSAQYITLLTYPHHNL